MSAFLGQIHYWLYKKIQLVCAREKLIETEAEKRVGDLASELHFTALDMYGEPIPADRNLQMIIDHSNIHGWLQHQIEVATVREGTFIKDLTDCGGEDAVEAVLNAFVIQGAACGVEAAKQLEGQDVTPHAVYKVMQDYYLNGMPCDAGDTIVQDDEQGYAWLGSYDNQRANWAKAGVSQVIMMAAYQAWFDAFVTKAAPGFTFTVEIHQGEVPICKINAPAK